MVDRARVNDFIQRWRLVIPNERLFAEFRSRVVKPVRDFLSSLSSLSYGQVSNSLEEQFAHFNGSKYRPDAKYASGQNIGTFTEAAPGFSDLVIVLQRLFWAVAVLRPKLSVLESSGFEPKLAVLLAQINTAIDHSPGIAIRRIAQGPDGIELYPEGVAILDSVVDANSIWLKAYPDVLAEYQKALTIVATKQEAMYRQALDGLRFALEKLVKLVLANNAPLEKQKEHLLPWLKDRGVHAHVRNTFVTLIDQFCAYQNATVKHDNEPDRLELRSWSVAEVEFAIYL